VKPILLNYSYKEILFGYLFLPFSDGKQQKQYSVFVDLVLNCENIRKYQKRSENIL